MHSGKTAFVLVAVCLALVRGQAEVRLSAHVVDDDLVVRSTVSDSFADDEAARILYRPTYEKDGWDHLQVKTNPKFDDRVAAIAAGKLEGQATAHRIHMHAINTGVLGSKPSEKIVKFLHENDQFVTEQIKKASELKANDPTRTYWYQVDLVRAQLEGICQGYNSSDYGKQNPLDCWHVLFINLDGDMEDLGNAVADPPVAADVLAFQANKCSALLRLAPDNKDVFIAQDTWSSLNSMMRIYKYYDFDFALNSGNTQQRVPGRMVSFSSYPGALFSGDDFYTLSSGLVVMETTIGYSNPELSKYIVPDTVLEWTRNIIANRLAHDLESWVATYRQHNSGTYNNMNMLFNYNKFVPGKPLVNGTFMICEQIPGTIIANDLSEMLQRDRYFGSYNVAFDPKIRELSGANNNVKVYGDWFDYFRTARAKIFKRDAVKIEDLASMQKMMRYNDYKRDPLSTQMDTCAFRGWHNCTPPYTSENTIATRGDLNPADGVYSLSAFGQRNHVATDSKITTFSSFNTTSLPAYIICGPTNDQQPTFQWSTSPYKDTPHVGMPDRFDYSWLQVTGGDL